MTLIIDKKDCECDEDGKIWAADRKSFYYCYQHSVEGSQNIMGGIAKDLAKRIEDLENKLQKIAKFLTP